MKILLVYNSYQRPNGEDAIFSQERQMLERNGHEVLTYRRSNTEITDYSGLKQVSLMKRAVWASDAKQDVADILRREKPDIMHVHNSFVMVSPSVYSACKEAGVPVVTTLHNYRLLCPASTFFRDGKVCEECVDHGLWRAAAYGCYRESRMASATVALTIAVHRSLGTWNNLVDGYLAGTEFGRQKYIASGLPRDKVLVKPNFVDVDPGTREGLGDCAVFMGRLSEEKGVRTLLAAWSQLKCEIPLNILGDGPIRKSLEKDAQRRAKNIRFTGWLPLEGKFAALKQARFLAMPSEWYEGFPMVILEAFACGVPVICSRLGAMQEAVEDGRTGLHFTPGDAEDLARKVEWAWTHPEEMARMGRAARAEYETKYSAAQNYQLLLGIYKQIIAGYTTEN